MTFTFSTGAAQGVNRHRQTNCGAVWVNEDATLLHTHIHTHTLTCAEQFVPLHCDYLSRLALHIFLCLNKNCGRPPLSCNLFVYCLLARPTPTPAAVVTLALANFTWPPTPWLPAPPAAHFPSCLPLDSLAEDEQVCFATFLRPRKPAIFHCCCVCPASSASPFSPVSPALFFVFLLLCPPAQFMRVA